MGACGKTYGLDGKKTAQQVQKWFNEQRDEETREYGTDPYSGALGTVCGLSVVTNRQFNNKDEAYDWLEDNTAKRYATAVLCEDVREELKKPVTFGKIGNIALTYKRSYYITHGSVVAADQLTDRQKEIIVRLVEEFRAKDKENRHAEDLLNNEIRKLRNLKESYNGYSTLRSLRAKAKKAFTARAKAEQKLQETDERYCKKLYKTKTTNKGKMWLIYALCAE